MSLGVALPGCLRSYEELDIRRKTRRYVGWPELPDTNVISRCANHDVQYIIKRDNFISEILEKMHKKMWVKDSRRHRRYTSGHFLLLRSLKSDANAV